MQIFILLRLHGYSFRIKITTSAQKATRPKCFVSVTKQELQMIEWMQPKRGGKAGSGAYMAISVTTASNKAAAQISNQLVIRFGPDAIKNLRLIAGDRVVVGLDSSSKEVCFKRTTDHKGYKVSGKSGASLTVSATMKLAIMPVQTIAIEDVKVEGTHVAIRCPSLFAVCVSSGRG